MERFKKMKMTTKVFKRGAAADPSPPLPPLLPAVPRPGRRHATTGALRHSRSLEDFVLPSKNHEDGTKKKKRYGLSEAPAAIPTHHRQISNPIPIPHQSGIDRWLAPEPSSNTPPFIRAGPTAVRPSGPIITTEQSSNSADPYYISSRTLDKFPLPPGGREFKTDRCIQRSRADLEVKQTRGPNATSSYATVRERGAAAIDDRDIRPPHVPRGWDFVQPQHIVSRNSPGWESEDNDDDNDLVYHTYHGPPSYPQIRPTQPLVIRKHLNPNQSTQALRAGASTSAIPAAAAKAPGVVPTNNHILKQNMTKPTTPDIYRSASDTSHYRKNTLYENPRRPPADPLSGGNTNTLPSMAPTASSSSHGTSTGPLHMRTQSAQAAYNIMPVAAAPCEKPSSSSPSERQEKQQQRSPQKTAWYRPSPGKQPPTVRLRSSPVSQKPVVVRNKTKHPDYSGSFFEDD